MNGAVLKQSCSEPSLILFSRPTALFFFLRVFVTFSTLWNGRLAFLSRSFFPFLPPSHPLFSFRACFSFLPVLCVLTGGLTRFIFFLLHISAAAHFNSSGFFFSPFKGTRWALARPTRVPSLSRDGGGSERGQP